MRDWSGTPQSISGCCSTKQSWMYAMDWCLTSAALIRRDTYFLVQPAAGVHYFLAGR